MSLGEKVTVEKAVVEVVEKKAEVGVVVEKVAEAEKEDGEVEVESGLKKPEGIVQASPSMPPSA